MSILSNNIQLIRGVANLKQDEFADVVVPKNKKIKDEKKEIKNRRAIISSYESGVAMPKLVVLMNIAEFAGVKTEDLSTRLLSVHDITINSEKVEKKNKTSVSPDEVIKKIRQEMTLVNATLQVHGLKIINLESKITDKPFDEVFSDHQRKIEQEVKRLEALTDSL